MGKQSKLVLFDWGGVLGHVGNINSNPVEFFRKLAIELEVYGEVEDNFEERLRNLMLKSKEYESLVTVSDIYTDTYITMLIDTMFDLKPTYDNISRFKESYLRVFCSYKANTELVKYAHSLKDRCHIGLLSNCAVIEKFKQDIDVQRSEFEYVYISCDLGFRKPDPRIYNIADANKFEIFFVDDRRENLLYPLELGWKVHLFDGDNQKLIDKIEEFLNN